MDPPKKAWKETHKLLLESPTRSGTEVEMGKEGEDEDLPVLYSSVLF